jgi:hypothetical protein
MAGSSTVITNISGVTRYFGWFPPHGKTIENGASLSTRGVLEAELASLKTDVKLKSFLKDLQNGFIEVNYNLINSDGSGQGGTGVPSDAVEVIPTSDKDLVPLTTANLNYVWTGLIISQTPAGDGFVDVKLNGVSYPLSDGDRSKVFYFSNDNGATGRPIQNITAGDKLYVNCIILGFTLDPLDRVDFLYNVTV